MLDRLWVFIPHTQIEFSYFFIYCWLRILYCFLISKWHQDGSSFFIFWINFHQKSTTLFIIHHSIWTRRRKKDVVWSLRVMQKIMMCVTSVICLSFFDDYCFKDENKMPKLSVENKGSYLHFTLFNTTACLIIILLLPVIS